MLTSRRIRFIVPVVACLALFTSQALARVGAPGGGGRAQHAARIEPIQLPARAPAADPVVAGAYGYHTARQLARGLERQAARDRGGPAAASPGGAGATVTVTATVLPVRTIVVRHGRVAEVWSNLPGTDPGASLYQVRVGSTSGAQAMLTARTWAQVRVLLRRAHPGPGRIA